MPRPALAKVSTEALQAEIQRRVSKLAGLLKLRDGIEQQIGELKALASQFGQAAETPKARRGRRKGRKVTAMAKKPVAAKKGTRGQYDQTAEEFVLGLLAGGKVLTSSDLTADWASSGRKGKVDNTLTRLVADKKLKRRKIRGKRGSRYKLA